MTFTNAEGKQDFIAADEVNAIARSGRSTWQEYAETPTVYTTEVPGQLAAMHGRPGAVECGLRPVDLPFDECARRKSFEDMAKGEIHWNTGGRGACTSKMYTGMMFPSAQFALAHDHPRRCNECARLYTERDREGLPWTPKDVLMLRRNWKTPDRAAFLLRRTLYSCAIKWARTGTNGG